VQGGKAKKICDRRDDARTGRSIRACDQRLDRHRAVRGDGVPRRAPIPKGVGGEGRLAHTGVGGEAEPDCVLPSSARRGLDHAAEQAPAYVRVRPEAGRRHGRGDIRREPRERAVVLVLAAGEAELQPGEQRKPGPIRKKVAQGRALGPAASAQLRHVRDHRIIQR
jgi:hypothetical protein